MRSLIPASIYGNHTSIGQLGFQHTNKKLIKFSKKIQKFKNIKKIYVDQTISKLF